MCFRLIKLFRIFSLSCVLAFILGLSFYAHANSTQPQGQPVEVIGDKVEFSIAENKVIAEGNVSIKRDDVTLLCDKVVYDRATKIAEAEGRVVVIRSGERLIGEKMSFNFETMKGIFSDGKFFSDPFYGSGEKITRISEGHVRIENGYITTSDFDKPEYRLYSNRVDIYPGEKAIARNVRLLVGNMPIMYFPKYTQDLTGKEPAVIFTPGYDKHWGEFLLSRWRFEMTKNVKGVTHLDYRSRKGLAGGVDVTYKTVYAGNGIVRTYYMNERKTSSKHHFWKDRDIPTIERERFKAEWRHRWQINPNTQAMLQYYRLSDAEFLKDYFEREYDEDNSPETYFLLTHALPIGTLSFRADARVNRFVDAVERLPEINFSMQNQRILNTRFYVKSETTYSNLTKKLASPSEDRKETMRLDMDNEISYPFKLGFVELKPFVGTRQTYYSKTKDRGHYNSIRGIFKTGADLSTKFYRIYDVQIDKWNLNINRLRHVVTPSIAYKYTHEPTVGASRLDQFDSIDSLTRGHKLHFSLENKLQTKSGKASVDMFRMITGVDYLLKEDTGKGGFNDISVDIEAKPYRWLTFYFDSIYDPIEEHLETANIDMYLNGQEDRWYLRLGKRYNVDVDDLFTTEFGWRINPKWKFRTYQRYDLETGSLQEQEYGLQRDLHTWLFDINFNQTRGEGSEIWMVFTLKAFPDIGFDFSTGFNKRKAGSENLDTVE